MIMKKNDTRLRITYFLFIIFNLSSVHFEIQLLEKKEYLPDLVPPAPD